MKAIATHYSRALLLLAFSFAVEAASPVICNHLSQELLQTEPAAKSFEKELLGPYADISALTASNLQHAYITFIGKVRSRQSVWSATEWKQVKSVMAKLDSRKNSMDQLLRVADKAQIRNIQDEFKAIEAKSNSKD
ncbi:hypothetical protein [uncultured Pontibacter sp.]|uniref:hypothetical protein n=1 Tax=uncultured Pontibacter sp. TaxID=453356 RepID=UPI002635F89C|nr:hypothetical protein [uncultured Pontibacter sp.]